MGGHYGSIHVRTDDREVVKSAVEAITSDRTRCFLIAPPINGWVTVFPENNGQDETVCEALATKLADKTMIHCLVHDDDIFAYWLFERGRLKDRYNSCPAYFGDKNPLPRGGNAKVFSHLLADEREVAKLQSLLDADQFTFEVERLEQFAGLLRLPNTVSAYEYLQEGEHDGIQQWKKFVHVPDLTAEKSTRRTAAAKVRAELKRLKEGETLLVDELAEKGANKFSFNHPIWTVNPSTSEIFLTWLDETTAGSARRAWRRFAAPEWKGEDRELPVTQTTHHVQFSPSGQFAAVQPIGRSTIEIWDWRDKKPVAERKFSGILGTAVFSPDESRLFAMVHGELKRELHLVDLQQAQMDLVVSLKCRQCQVLAPHPGGRWLALAYDGALGLFDLVEKGEVRLFGIGGMYDLSRMMAQYQAKLEQMFSQAAGRLSPEHMEKIRQQLQQQRESQHYQPKEFIVVMEFTPDGRWLICGTDAGVRVFEWTKLQTVRQASPTPDFSVDAEEITPNLADPGRIPGRRVYSITYDYLRKRVLFGGLEGKVKYLDIVSGKSGDLLGGPERTSILELSLTPDRGALVMTRMPVSSRNDSKRQRFQIWNYAALCQAAGLDF